MREVHQLDVKCGLPRVHRGVLVVVLSGVGLGLSYVDVVVVKDRTLSN